MTSTLSVFAHAHTTRRPSGASLEGALHMRRRRQRMRMLSPAVLEECELWCDQPPGATAPWTHAGMLCVFTVLQMRHTPRCDGPGESVGAVNG